MNKQNTRNKDEELRGLSIFAIFIFFKDERYHVRFAVQPWIIFVSTWYGYVVWTKPEFEQNWSSNRNWTPVLFELLMQLV